MSLAYLDCASGISGDMTLGALVDAGVDLAAVQAGIDSLGLPSCTLRVETVKKRGFRATQLVVEHEPEHAHRHLSHIEAMIEGSVLTPRQRELARAIFGKLAAAEAKVHGSTIEKVHFHEVGAVDSIADIVGTAIAIDLLGIKRIVCSPIPTGHGFVTIAHGRCAIPAPATAELLATAGAPLAACDCEGELTTPTGAAIVAALAESFGPLPALTIDRIGYGAGQKDFPQPNLLRLIVGTPVEPAAAATGSPQADAIVELRTNIDDASGEMIGRCVERLWQAGALDVATSPLQMKGGRPGVLLTVQCRPGDDRCLAELIFRETTTLGLRREFVERLTLPRRTATVLTPWGEVTGIVATLPDGAERFSPEYRSCVAASDRHDVTWRQVDAAARQAYLNAPG